MRRLLAILLMCCCGWVTIAQNFPYQVSVQTVAGHCYDDAHLIFTLSDNNGNIIQIDPQTHQAVNIAQYPLYNVQYHYQNVASAGIQYDYSNDIMLSAGTYCVGVTANVPTQGGMILVDTTFCNVQVTTSYQHLEASALFNLANPTYDGHERYGYWPSFHCADLGRIQLQITQGSFPYQVTILDEQQDTVRHAVFHHRVNNGNFTSYADYRDYYTFDSLPIGTYSIIVSDSCGYMVPISFTIPDAEPSSYGASIDVKNYSCPDGSLIPFRLLINSNTQNQWNNYTHHYFDSVLQYRFINPGNDTTEWMRLSVSSWYSFSNRIYDTLPDYCVIFDDTVTFQIRDVCRDTILTYGFKFQPQFNFIDSTKMVDIWDSAIQDTCTVHLVSGFSTQAYKIGGGVFTPISYSINGVANHVRVVPFRYFKCPLSYNVWLMPDSILLGQSESDDFTGLGNWVTFGVDTTVQVHVSVTDAGNCIVAEKDTTLVFNPEPLDSLFPWFECHNEKEDDGKDHCCGERYLWIQEHGVDADIFRQNMTLRLIESPLYNQFNFTAIRQEGVWNVTFDDQSNHSSYVEFSYPDGWRATLRDTVCLPPGRYVFEVSTDCGVDTVIKEWAGFFYDTHEFTSAPQYEMKQICDRVEVTQISTGLEAYIYFIDPSVSNDVPIQEPCSHYVGSYSTAGINPVMDSQGRYVYSFSVPGIYNISNYAYNELSFHGVHTGYVDCINDCTHSDSITVTFSYLDFETATALLCNSASVTGVVSAQAINGNAPYTYTLYDQEGTVISSNSTGFFDNVPMTMGQQFTVQVTDSCSTSFSVNITAALLTHENLLWEQGPNAGQSHCAGDTVHLTALTFPPPATYQWTGPNGFSSSSQTIDVVPDGDGGWYKVEILNSMCGSLITDSIYVSVVTPQVTISGDSVACPGGNVTLHASATNAVVPPPLAIGDILCTDGTTVKPSAYTASGKTALGVVFYVDNTGEHGWAVHLDDQSMGIFWTVEGQFEDIPNLDNFTEPRNAIMDLDGYSNTQKIRNAGDASRYPAAYAVDFDNGWYLPAAGQLRLLFAETLTLNQSLQVVNGTLFQVDDMYFYWTSTEYGLNRAWEVSNTGNTSHYDKNTANIEYIGVRSIRNF